MAEADEDNYKQLEMNCLKMATLETMQTKLKFLFAPLCVRTKGGAGLLPMYVCVWMSLCVGVCVISENIWGAKVKGSAWIGFKF